MSVRVQITGDGLGGKSTLAAHIALIIAELRQRPVSPPKRRRKAEPLAPLRAFAISTSPAVSYEPYAEEITVQRTRTMNGILRHLRAADAPLIIDDLSDVYASLLERWRELVGEQRDRRGLPRKVQLAPGDWQAINLRYWQIFTKCLSQGVDLVEVYRRAPIYVADADLGMVNGDGVQNRGQAEAGAGANLAIVVEGGLRSRYQTSWERSFRVFADGAGLLNGEPRRLPALRKPEDRVALHAELRDFLAPSLRHLIRVTDLEAAAWVDLNEPTDEWGEATEVACRAEAGLLVSQISGLINMHGMGGQTAVNIQRRSTLLMTHFGVGDTKGLEDVSVHVLRDNVDSFEAAVLSWKESAAA